MNVFSTWAIQRFTAGSITWAGREIGVALLTRAPNDPNPDLPPALASLVTSLGFSEQVDAAYSRVDAAVTSSVSGTTTRVVIGEDYLLPTNVSPAYIRAAVFFLKGTQDGVTDPWLFITDITFDQVVYQGSTMTTRFQTPRILFTYTPRGTSVDAAVGGLIRSPGSPLWEPPRTQHVFLYPERTNWAINPSFEDVGLFGWRAATSITRVAGGVDNTANFYAAIAGNRLESLPVCTGLGLYRVSGYLRSKGATTVRLGVASWFDDWLTPNDMLGPPRPLGSGWTRLDALVPSAEGHAGTGVLVTSNGAFDADLMLLENTADLNDYFDGDSQTSLIGDFSWQGVTHRTPAFWYNNRYLVGARLFGQYSEGAVAQEGLVFDWLPENTAVYTHWDLHSVDDTRQPYTDWPSRII